MSIALDGTVINYQYFLEQKLTAIRFTLFELHLKNIYLASKSFNNSWVEFSSTKISQFVDGAA